MELVATMLRLNTSQVLAHVDDLQHIFVPVANVHF